jgi:hypothetical protein
MGFEPIPGSDATYGLISFDNEGRERLEGTSVFSARLLEYTAAHPVTDIFFFVHGWMGDLVAARDQYGRWMSALLASADRQGAAQRFGSFSPLLVGLHWPSLPWGDEELSGAAFAAAGAAGLDRLRDSFLERLGHRDEIRRPLEIILREARTNAAPEQLPAHVADAYRDLNDALGLESGGLDAPPDADREVFEPQEAFTAANDDVSFGGLNLGGVLGPLRQLSYWTMKKRARTVGEGGMHTFLNNLQQVTAAQGTRIHLMGHSFGTIVVSGMLGGPGARGTLQRSIDSVVLVQGAVSLWCYAASIPFAGAGAGYFSRILGDRKIKGPLVVTRSKHDSAVGVLYPLASRLRGSASFAPLPEYGAIGAYGLQGLASPMASDSKMLAANGAYQFSHGRIYNLDASQFIVKKQGVSGAHNDIDGPEVAHAIWQAAFASA